MAAVLTTGKQSSGRTLTVGMGEIVVTRDVTEDLVCLGLGSCIAVCVYDGRLRVAGMAHVVLPGRPEGGKATATPHRYADSAVPFLIAEMARVTGGTRGLRVALCGGASIFPGLTGLMDIGQRNIEAVRASLRQAGIPIVREDVGGTGSRTVTLHTATGNVGVRRLRTDEELLVTLGSHDAAS